jgi:hypothetical protein
MPLPPHTVIDAPADRGSRRAPVWLPWLLAPAFLLLPIGGCGAAAAFRRPLSPGATAAGTTASLRLPLPGPAIPMATVMPVARPVR